MLCLVWQDMPVVRINLIIADLVHWPVYTQPRSLAFQVHQCQNPPQQHAVILLRCSSGGACSCLLACLQEHVSFSLELRRNSLQSAQIAKSTAAICCGTCFEAESARVRACVQEYVGSILELLRNLNLKCTDFKVPHSNMLWHLF
jgi:hypothetical protein